MKKETKFKFDLLPIVGIAGLLLVAMYFLLAGLNGDSASKPPPKDPYYLFYKLYRKLGYRITNQYQRNLPQPKDNLLIYLNYNNQERELTAIIDQWVNQGGGTLFIAGITGDRDPVSSAGLQMSRVKSVYINHSVPKNQSAGAEPLFNSRERYLKLLSNHHALTTENIILYSEQGPLLYKTTKGAGSIFVLSDSALLTNDYLREDNAAIFFNQLFRAYFYKRIYLIRADLAGSPQTIPILALLFRDKLLFITGQLLWIIALLIAWQGKRFGEPQWLDPYARRTLREHLKAIGHFYQKTNALGIVDEINCDYFKYRLHKITGFQIKDALRPEDYEKLEKYSGPGFSREQIMEGLKKEPKITFGRLQNKGKKQDGILKSIKS